MGCAMPEAEQGMNVARARPSRRAPRRDFGDDHQPLLLVGLQSIAIAADRIRAGGADVIVAGGPRRCR
jgi:acetyl-CoA acyltransferase